MALSVVIPIGENDSSWKDLLPDLEFLSKEDEVLFVGDEKTLAEVRSVAGARYTTVLSGRGRAIQLNAGARAAKREYLWFLHCDSRLVPETVKALRDSITESSEAVHFFDLKFHDGSTLTKITEAGAWLRSRIFRLPFGDQGFCVARSLFYSLRFEENAPYGEDHLFVWAAHQAGIPLRAVSFPLLTSARKYQRNGWASTTARHLWFTVKQAGPKFCQLFRRRPALVIFVKTPGFSPVKTRLAKEIGEVQALEFYHLSVGATEAVGQSLKNSLPDLAVYWAVAEDACLGSSLWKNFPVVRQGEGSLGERLARVYGFLLAWHSSVSFLGADSPHIQAGELKKNVLAVECERAQSFQLARTLDGGFYFFGGSIKLPRKAWMNVKYSAPETASQLAEELSRYGTVRQLGESFDVDTKEDLFRLARVETVELLKKQRELIEWAKQVTGRPGGALPASRQT